MAVLVTIDATGIHTPTFEDYLADITAAYQAIYGADVYLGNDSQDGQFLGILARAQADLANALVAAYNSYSPNSAQGEGLSSAVKINGLTRAVPTYSQVDVNLLVDPGTTIINGTIQDANGVVWNLPPNVTVSTGTTITVTATAASIGQITALPNTLTIIGTPTRGWISVTNPAAAVPGQPVEDDAALRAQQAVSTALPSQTVLQGTLGAILAVSGVTSAKLYENDTGSTDANGIPAHSIALVVLGGDALAIATQLLLKKTLGTSTYGTTTETVIDSSGYSNTVNFFRPTLVPITIVVTLHNLTGYSTVIATEIQNALIAYFLNYTIGDDVLYTKLYVPANLTGTDSATFDLISVAIARSGSPAEANVVIAFNELATLALADISIVVS